MIRLGVKLCSKQLFPPIAKSCNAEGRSALTKFSITGLTPITREIGFFNKYPATQLWTAITTVSNAGRKRGREKMVRKRPAKDLNRGQHLGVGVDNVVFPGLNRNVLQGKEVIHIRRLPPNPEREQRLNEIRNSMDRKRRMKLHPLERGWSGQRLPGRNIGHPADVDGEVFEHFDSICLHSRLVFCMRKTGNNRRLAHLVAVGNRNGLIGVGIGRSMDSKKAQDRAKRRALTKIIPVPIFENRTVLHSFFSQYGRSKITVMKKPEGYGLVCHRAIKAICQLAGIKDIYAQAEGPRNVHALVKAFLIGLTLQKSHQKIADEKKLHFVEVNGYFPRVLASPEKCLTPEEAKKDDLLDFHQYIFNGKIYHHKEKRIPFFQRLPCWLIRCKKVAYRRNHHKVRMELYEEYGDLHSFLTKDYPDASVKYRFNEAELKRQNEQQ